MKKAIIFGTGVFPETLYYYLRQQYIYIYIYTDLPSRTGFAAAIHTWICRLSILKMWKKSFHQMNMVYISVLDIQI